MYALIAYVVGGCHARDACDRHAGVERVAWFACFDVPDR
jgi:uncharacterized ParB-like nuclease family protein